MAGNKEHVEITISVRDKEAKPFLFEESPEEYVKNLREAIDDVDNKRNLITFSAEEFEKFAESLSRK